ncbi:MAG: hypothetical protein CR217_10150 [Beijerinckiaceae bacterium]|nr:MAG: hypothetical protein CR217_10150 [Beijerinckiaceae bacterium]
MCFPNFLPGTLVFVAVRCLARTRAKSLRAKSRASMTNTAAHASVTGSRLSRRAFDRIERPHVPL